MEEDIQNTASGKGKKGSVGRKERAESMASVKQHINSKKMGAYYRKYWWD